MQAFDDAAEKIESINAGRHETACAYAGPRAKHDHAVLVKGRLVVAEEGRARAPVRRLVVIVDCLVPGDRLSQCLRGHQKAANQDGTHDDAGRNFRVELFFHGRVSWTESDASIN